MRTSPSRILEALAWDGGWLTTAGVQLLVPETSELGVDRALYRLSQKGLVEHRTVGLAGSAKSSNRGVSVNVESRSEWRAVL